MKKKFLALMFIWAFALNGIGAMTAAAQTNNRMTQNSLLGNLPVSDGAMTLNMQRVLSEALPQAMSGNQPMLADVLRKIDEVKAKTGVDLRQFQQIVVGVSGKKNAAQEIEFEPVILARGTFDANALTALARSVPKAKYREEKIGSRTVYVFEPQQIPSSSPSPAKSPSMIEKTVGNTVNKFFAGLSREIAVSAFDTNTLAIGTLARLRETFGTSARVGSDVLNLVNRKPDAIMSFGLKLPEGLSPFVNLGNDELGKNLNAIRFMAGAADFADGNGTVSILARTTGAEQAKSLQEQIEGFQQLGKMFLGGAKDANKQVYARMIDNVKIARNLTDVMLDLQVPQSDINTLLGKNQTGISASK